MNCDSLHFVIQKWSLPIYRVIYILKDNKSSFFLVSYNFPSYVKEGVRGIRLFYNFINTLCIPFIQNKNYFVIIFNLYIEI